MFATSGYFKGVDCPYYLSGLCERPYCHFRHVKKDDGRDASSSHLSGSRPSSPVDQVLGQCSGPTGSKPVGPGSYLTKTGPTGSISAVNVPAGTTKFVEEYSVEDEAAIDGPAYEPTPKYEVAGKTKRKLSTDCLYQPGGPAVEVPEYEPNHVPGSKPDPTAEYKPGSVPKFSTAAQERYVPGIQKKVSKSQAKKRRANPPGVPEVIPEYVPSSVAQYNPTPKNQLKKMKKNADTDLEYDPVNNYVCNVNPAQEDVGEVVYVPTKRPKMDEEEGGEDNAVCMDLDEFGDSDDAKFSSDEELDKSELIMDSGRYESPLEEESDDEEVIEIFAVKPFFRDTSVDKSSDSNIASQNMNVCENELKHLVRKPVSSLKGEGDKIIPENSKKQKSEQSGKSKSDSKGKDKLEKSDKSSKHSSQSSSHKSSSKDSNGKSTDSSVRKDISNSKSSKSVNGSHSSKSSKHSEHSKSKTNPSSSKSSEKKTDSLSGSASESKSSKHSERDKSKHSEHEKHRDSSSKTDKDSSKSSSAEKKHKSDSHRSHSSSHSKHRSSSKDSSHRKEHHKESKDKFKESENKKSKNSHSKSSSSSHGHKSSSGSSNGHSHSSKSGSKSEKENKNKHEKSKSSSSSSSSSSKNSKEKSVGKAKDLAHINEDLFGSESEEEDTKNKSNNNSQEMTDVELAKFLEDSDFESDDDTFEECLKIFNEDAPSFSKLKLEKKKDANHSQNNEAAVVPGKKRVARSKDSRPFKQAAPKVPVKMSPAQVMHNRLAEMQRRALEAAEARKAVAEAHAATSSSSTSQGMGGSKNRLARIPRSRSTEGKSLNDREEDKRTVAITAARGQKRTAHAPTISNVKRPTIPAEFGGKVPSNIRQRYLNLIIDECLKICKTEEGAYKKGQEEETAVYKRATNKNIYLRVAVNAIKRLRVEAVQASPSPTKSSPSKIVKQSHEAMLGGKNATKTTYTLHRSGGGNKAHTDDFKGADLYQRLSKYIMTEDQLKENGYPRPHPEGGSKAVFFKDRNEKDVILKAHEKNCVRCGKRFIVFPNGSYNREEECIYHWGKAWKKRVDRALITSYNCCGGDLEAEGCQVCKFHVYESNKAENVTGYMKTIPSSPPIDGDYGVYAMDCEMVYTKGGMELARVTVIDSESKPVYEALVQPDFPVIDHNTRFSGLTEEDLKGVKTTLRDVQAVLLSLFTDKTILIGHSLESDLISVKLIHNTVVDTSIVFPHRLGPPYKRALRNLMVDFLKKIIQDDVGGHDSQEDALACLQLMQWKLKEDAKKEIRRI